MNSGPGTSGYLRPWPRVLKRMAVVTAPTGLAKVMYEDAATDMESQAFSMRLFDSLPAATVWAQSGLAERKRP